MSIPVEFFPPFVEAAVQALQEVDPKAVTSFRWAMALLGKILTRTVVEGQVTPLSLALFMPFDILFTCLFDVFSPLFSWFLDVFGMLFTVFMRRKGF